MYLWRASFALFLVVLRLVSGITTVNIKGSKFFNIKGDQIYIKGILYLGGNSLTNGTQCSIDAKLMRQLGANVVRIDQIAFNATVADCLRAFGEQDLYVLASLGQLQPSNLNNEPVWTTTLRDKLARNLDELQKYDNLLGLYISDWADRMQWSDANAAVLKAAVADLKAYRDAMRYRHLPIGVFRSGGLFSKANMNFFDCGNETIAADFYSFAVTGLCSDTDFGTSSFNETVDMAGDFDVPVLIADNTCSGSRSFSDQPWVLGQWSDRISGNILAEWYSYFTTGEEVSELSFVNYTDNAATGTPSLLPAYSVLSSQWATLSPSGTQATSYTPTATKQACPKSATDWALDERAGTDIPTLGLSGLTTATPPTAKDTGTADNSSHAEKANLAAVIGGVVGGLVGLILILVTFFWLRRKKGAGTPAAPAGTDPWSDKQFDDPSDRIRMIQDPNHHELYGVHAAQELLTKNTTARVFASEVPATERAQELQYVNSPVRNIPTDLNTCDGIQLEDMTPAAIAPSAHVQAQRYRELEWLAQEEARMREQRERLMQQATQWSSPLNCRLLNCLCWAP